MDLPDPTERPVITVAEAAQLVGVARRTGYEAAKRGEWPAVRTGRAVRIRTRQFLELYDLLPSDSGERDVPIQTH